MKYLLLLLCSLLSLVSFAQKIPTSKAKLGELHFGNRVGGVVGQEGASSVFKLWDFGEGDSLISLRVNYDWVVKAMECCTSKKGCQVFGNPTAEWSEAILVPNGASIIGISGAAGWFIDSISFHFSDGSQSEVYGGKGGDLHYELLLNKDEKGQWKGEFLGFWGSYTHSLETLGLLFWPIE